MSMREVEIAIEKTAIPFRQFNHFVECLFSICHCSTLRFFSRVASFFPFDSLQFDQLWRQSLQFISFHILMNYNFYWWARVWVCKLLLPLLFVNFSLSFCRERTLTVCACKSKHPFEFLVYSCFFLLDIHSLIWCLNLSVPSVERIECKKWRWHGAKRNKYGAIVSTRVLLIIRKRRSNEWNNSSNTNTWETSTDLLAYWFTDLLLTVRLKEWVPVYKISAVNEQLNRKEPITCEMQPHKWHMHSKI